MSLVLLAALLCAGQGEKKPPVKVDPKKVDEAIKKGIAYLKGVDDDFNDTRELVLWTYLHAGLSEEDSHVKAILDKKLAMPLLKTYNVSLQAMILEKLDRVKHQNRIFHCAQFLADNQWDYGQWGYGRPTNLPDPPPGDRPKVATSGKKKPGAADFDDKVVRWKLKVTQQAHDPVSRGDNSNSQYAALGLRACHDAGIVFPEEVLARAEKWWRESQVDGGARNAPGPPYVATGAAGNHPPAGWAYSSFGKGGVGPARGTMTVGGLGALAILDSIRGKSWKSDPDVLEAVSWVAANFSVDNGGRGHPYYYLYGLERAGALYGTDFFGPHEWYPLGANYILEKQRPDGSWGHSQADVRREGVIDTCFAILFLRRGTPRLVDVASVDRFKKP